MATTKRYGTFVQDPPTKLVDAAEKGRNDGLKNHPKRSASGEPVTDYFGRLVEAQGETAAALHLAGHLDDARIRLDRYIAEGTASVVRLTAAVSDALFKVSAADHSRQVYNRLSMAERRQPWPTWLRIPLLGVMAVGTGAALSGALLELTSDEPYLAYAFCGGVTLAVVGLGAFLAHLTRDFEYGFTKGFLPKVVLVVGTLFAVFLMVALASIRGTAAKADAERQSRSDDSGLTVLLPGQPATEDQASTSDDEETPLPSVPAYAYGLLEGLLFMAAFGVEYINYLPWAKQQHQAETTVRAAERELHEGKEQLGPACGQLMAALDERADHDAAVLITGEATVTHGVAEMSEYRRTLLSHRPSSQGGDPFQPLDVDNGKAQASVTRQVAERWGRDLQPAGLISDDADRMEIDQLPSTALARGLVMLAKVPERAAFTPVTWDPASLVSDISSAPIGVKPGGRSTNRKPARRSSSKRGNNDGARQ